MSTDPDLPPTAVVVVAAGAGTRVGAPVNKVLLPLLGRPVLAWALRTACSLPYVARVVVVVRPQDTDLVERLVREHLDEDQEVSVVTGGATRHDSEQRGLSVLREDVQRGRLDLVAVHDAARPLADAALFEAVVRAAHLHGAAVPVRPQAGVLARDGLGHVAGLAGVQTPQVFRAGPLLAAYDRAAVEGFAGTDTAGCVAAYTDLVVHAVPAPATNLKITFPEDVELAARLLGGG